MLASFTIFKVSTFEWKDTPYQELTLLDAAAVPIEQMCKLAMPEKNAPYPTSELKAGEKIMVNIEKIDVKNGNPSFRGSYERKAK